MSYLCMLWAILINMKQYLYKYRTCTIYTSYESGVYEKKSKGKCSSCLIRFPQKFIEIPQNNHLFSPNTANKIIKQFRAHLPNFLEFFIILRG